MNDAELFEQISAEVDKARTMPKTDAYEHLRLIVARLEDSLLRDWLLHEITDICGLTIRHGLK